MDGRRPIEFRGDALEALRRFPESARRQAGHQLDRVQVGLEPDDWKPMTSVGSGVREIRVRDERGISRVMYVTKMGEIVYVLHCFQKKSQKTSGRDLALATRRYLELKKELAS